MQSTTLLCRLLERCGCPCEAKIEEAQGQFLLYIHEEHTAADHKDNSSRYLSVNMQDFISKAVKTAPMNTEAWLVLCLKDCSYEDVGVKLLDYLCQWLAK